jgi:rRNA-processing protein FCF1
VLVLGRKKEVPAKPLREFIIDADVFIDYRDSDIGILSQFSAQLGQLHVGRSTLENVKRVTEAEARRLKIVIETPDLELAIAASQARGKLSYDDHETLLLAVRNSWGCITNDNALRTECRKEGIDLLWGLEPTKLLVRDGLLSLDKALKVARLIHECNPDHITKSILNRFESQLGESID